MLSTIQIKGLLLLSLSKTVCSTQYVNSSICLLICFRQINLEAVCGKDGKTEETKDSFEVQKREISFSENIEYIFSLCDGILFGIQGTWGEKVITLCTKKMKFSTGKLFQSTYQSLADC